MFFIINTKFYKLKTKVNFLRLRYINLKLYINLNLNYLMLQSMKITKHKMAQNVADLFTTKALHTQPPDESWAGK